MLVSGVRLFVTPWTVAHKAPLYMDFSRQEYWSGLPCPSPKDLPDPGIEPMFPTLQADSLPFELPRGTWNIFKVVSKTSTDDSIDCFLHFTKWKLWHSSFYFGGQGSKIAIHHSSFKHLSIITYLCFFGLRFQTEFNHCCCKTKLISLNSKKWLN